MGLSVPTTSTMAVSLAEIKAGLSIHSSNTDHDTELTSLEARASQILERHCNRAFIRRGSFVLTLDRFPDSNVIMVPRPPLVQVDSITYLDTDGNSQTWDSSKYYVGAASTPAKITPAINESWPTTQVRIEAVTITYTAGYGTTYESVPAPIRQALILCIRSWFERHDPAGTIPAGAMSLLQQYHPGVLGELYGVAS